MSLLIGAAQAKSQLAAVLLTLQVRAVIRAALTMSKGANRDLVLGFAVRFRVSIWTRPRLAVLTRVNMEPRELELLLRMVENLNRELDRYLTESSLPAEAIPQILNICQHMRAKSLDGAIQYWLGAIERHATEISDPQPPSDEIGSLPSPARLLNTELHLLKDIHNLHRLLTHSRGAIH